MRKEEFLAAVGQRLSLLPKEEMQSRLDYLGECIADRIEDGMTEEEAVAALGEPQQVADNVLLDVPLQLLMKSGKRPQLKGWHIALIIVGAVVWLPLGLAAVAVVLALLLTVAAVLISMCAVVLALCVGGLISTVYSVVRAISGDSAQLLLIGISVAAIGLGILLFFPVRSAIKLCVLGGRAVMVRFRKFLLKRRMAK